MNHAAMWSLNVEAMGSSGAEMSIIPFKSSGIGGLRRVILVGLSGYVYIVWFMTSLHTLSRPGRSKDSSWAQLHIGSRRSLSVCVEEEIRFFTLWHFYGGNCAMAWWLMVVTELFGAAKNLWGLLCFLFSAGWVTTYDSYVGTSTQSSPWFKAAICESPRCGHYLPYVHLVYVCPT